MSEIDLKEDNEKSLDDDIRMKNHSDKSENVFKKKRKFNPKQFLIDFFADKRKRLIFIIVIAAITLLLFALGFYFLLHGKSSPSKTSQNQTQPVAQTAQLAETLYQAPLDGLMATKEASERHPLAVIVENQVDARPQSGLDKASIVYEALAEGGITRFMAIFGTYEAEKVGPVRSARTYFVDWAHGFNAFFAHVGGNIDALDQIIAEKTYNLDQMHLGEPSFWRIETLGLAIEHTMYTSTTKLRAAAGAAGYPTINNFTVYKFKNDPSDTDKVNLPDKQKITIDYSSTSYNVYFQFDKATDSYFRFVGGTAQKDKVTGNQLNPKDIAVMTVASKPTLTRINEQGLDMTTIGSGKAEIFLDGKVINGTWKKDSKSAREMFFDDQGQEVTFNRGQLWICVVPTGVVPIVE